MGQKVDPRGFRVGPHRSWKSRWFSTGRDYADNVIQDLLIRRLLRRELVNAGLEKIEIERSPNQIKVILFASRPGVVIGRGGSGIQRLNQKLADLAKGKVSIDVETVKNPDTSAALIASSIARRIEKRFSYRRVMFSSAERAMEKGAKGVKILCAGVVGGPSSIARKTVITRGAVPSQTIRANIDFAKDTAYTTYGTIGVKVWVYKGDFQ